MNMHVSVLAMAVLAEVVGAFMFLILKKSIVRTLFSIFSLSFMFVVVFMDLLPDAGMYEHMDMTHISLFVAGVAAIAALGWLSQYAGNYAAVAGFGFHNLCEGIEIAAISSLSPIVMIGFLLHKLPEGMASFSLLDGVKDTRRFGISVLVALLIPIGALIPISEAVSQFVMSFGAGVIVMVVIKSIKVQLESIKTMPEVNMIKFTTAGISGILVGAVSCLIA